MNDYKILIRNPFQINSSMDMMDEFLVNKYDALALRNAFKFWPKDFKWPVMVTPIIIRYNTHLNRVESKLTYTNLSNARKMKMIYEDSEIQRTKEIMKRIFRFIDHISPLIHSFPKDENENTFYELSPYYQINIMINSDAGPYGWFDHQYGETTKFLISHIMWHSYRPHWYK